MRLVLIIALIALWMLAAAVQATQHPKVGKLDHPFLETLITVKRGQTVLKADPAGHIGRDTDQPNNLTGSLFWKQVDAFCGGTVRDFAPNGQGSFLAATDGGVYRSMNQSHQWQRLNMGTPTFTAISRILDHPAGVLLAATDDGIYRSSDNGLSWRNITGYGPDIRGFALDSNGVVFASGWRGGVMVSSDTGLTWTSISLAQVHLSDIRFDSRGNLFVGSEWGIYRSTDKGMSWDFLPLSDEYIRSVVIDSRSNLFACGYYSVFRSTDGGASWYRLNLEDDYFEKLYVDKESKLWAASYRGLQYSEDAGNSWTRVNLATTFVLTVTQIGSSYYAGTLYDGVFQAHSMSGPWVKTNGGLYASTVSPLLATSSGRVFAYLWKDYFYTDDAGLSWQIVTPPTADIIIFQPIHETPNRKLFVGAARGQRPGLARSTDDGETWSWLDGLNVHPNAVSAITSGRNGMIYAATSNGDIHRSGDEGQTWNLIYTHTSRIDAIVVDYGGFVYAANGNIIVRSTNGGLLWEKVGTGQIESHILTMIVNEENEVLVGTYTKTYLSTDRGFSWQILSPEYVHTFALGSNQTLYAASWQRVLQSTDAGRTWGDVSSGITALELNGLVVDRTGYVYAGTWLYGLYRTLAPIGGPPLPQQIQLAQNYPNPFNAETTIEFTLPTSGQVVIEVYDVIGRYVSTLLSKNLDAGYQRTRWNASSLSSGVYFYRVQTLGSSATRKSLLIR